MAYNIFILDPSQYEVWFDGQDYGSGTCKTVAEWAREKNAELCFNLGLFNLSTGDGYTYVHTARGDIGYGGQSDGVVIDHQNMCRGYTNAVRFGKVDVEFPLNRNAKRTRNGIGMTVDGYVIIAQSSHKVTEAAFAGAVNKFVARQGHRVKLFVLQDGGGSTSEASTVSKLSFRPEGGRAVATVVCVRRKAVPKVTRTLKLGSRGEDVKALQVILGGIEIDGAFGFNTRARLVQAQKALGLKADGSCGPITRAALGL